jgi:hypothetical protein
MVNNKFVVISQQNDTVTLSRFIGSKNDGILQFAFSELESQKDNASLVEYYRQHGDKILVDDLEPTAA